MVTAFVFNELQTNAQSLIDFRNTADLENRKPLMIAHRGGVITDETPECSRSAIRLAAARNYDMVELDIRSSSDGIPIVFHDQSLEEACGRYERVVDLKGEALVKIPYRNGSDKILTLRQALRECQQQGLGIMLDLKAGRESPKFLSLIDQMIVSEGFEHAAISFSGSPEARQHLKHIRFTPTAAEMTKLRHGNNASLKDRFWFGLPDQLSNQDIERLKNAGALIFPAINTFRYPASDHLALAEKDIKRLTQAGVDGFQIDSVYDGFFERTPINPSSPNSPSQQTGRKAP